MRESLRQNCPPIDRLTALFEERLGASESADLRKHIGECEMCDADWRMLQEFVDAKVEPAEQADVRSIVAAVEKSRKPVRKKGFVWGMLPRVAGVLAGVALLVAVGLQLQLKKSTDLSAFQDSGSLRSSQVIDLAPKGDFSALPAEFSWTAVGSAVSYEIVVSEVDGTVLWRGQAGVARLPMPEQLRAVLLPKKTVILQVTAVDGSGSRVARSEATRVRYNPGE